MFNTVSHAISGCRNHILFAHTVFKFISVILSYLTVFIFGRCAANSLRHINHVVRKARFHLVIYATFSYFS
nr:MAG TPA: hypothetical protein [Caudoviricetes sp.]